MRITETYLQVTKAPFVLSRKGGLFYRREIFLDDVVEVLAVNRDAVTFDEIQICFKCVNAREFLMSENDRNFKDVVETLRSTFPGIENWNNAGEGVPLRHRIRTLWRKK